MIDPVILKQWSCSLLIDRTSAYVQCPYLPALSEGFFLPVRSSTPDQWASVCTPTPSWKRILMFEYEPLDREDDRARPEFWKWIGIDPPVSLRLVSYFRMIELQLYKISKLIACHRNLRKKLKFRWKECCWKKFPKHLYLNHTLISHLQSHISFLSAAPYSKASNLLKITSQTILTAKYKPNLEEGASAGWLASKMRTAWWAREAMVYLSEINS